MKKLLTFILIVLILFIGLTYWSVSGSKNEFPRCKVIDPEGAEVNFKDYDSVKVIPSMLYKGNAVKKLMQGDNYRDTWATPVTIPVLFLDTLKGGMKFVKEGGGHQTHSLRFKSPDGTLYSMRSVNKDPQPLVPDIAKTLGLENIVVDGISGQHPFGAILASKLADAAGVRHTHPTMYFVPKQKALGKYNKEYGNRLFLMEYETEGETNWTDLKNVKEIVETDDLQELKMKLGDKLKVDKKELIKARLFDMLIGDWDRHAEQWGWILQEQHGTLEAIPMAGDRDNAFFYMDGVIPAILTNRHLNPLVRPYKKEIDFMEGLVYPFDVYFLHNTPEDMYVQEAKELQQLLSDRVIQEAFQAWPKPIAKRDEKEISEKIKSRRNSLVNYAKKFHKIVQKRGVLQEPLKGSDDLQLDKNLLECFDCK